MLGRPNLRVLLPFFLVAAGCSASSPSQSSTPDAAQGDAGPGDDGSAATPPDAAEEVAPICSTPTTYYLDADGDGFGGSSKQSACAPPGAQWVTARGDCDDEDATVYPGALPFHATGYMLQGQLSFDYNCDGVEEEAPGPAITKFSTCDSSCSGGGYKQAQNRPNMAGLDNLCGSNTTINCETQIMYVGGLMVIACNAVSSTATTTVMCR
jgi:hypothetical protein